MDMHEFMNIINKLKEKGIILEVNDEIHGYEVIGDKVWHGYAEHKPTGKKGFVLAIVSHATNLRLVIILTENEIDYLIKLKNDLERFIELINDKRREIA